MPIHLLISLAPQQKKGTGATVCGVAYDFLFVKEDVQPSRHYIVTIT